MKANGGYILFVSLIPGSNRLRIQIEATVSLEQLVTATKQSGVSLYAYLMQEDKELQTSIRTSDGCSEGHAVVSFSPPGKPGRKEYTCNTSCPSRDVQRHSCTIDTVPSAAGVKMHLLSECATFKVSFVLNGKPFKSKDASFCLTTHAAGGDSPKRSREAVSVIKVAIISGAVALILVLILALLYCCYKRVKKYDSFKMPPSIQFSLPSTLDTTVRTSREDLIGRTNGKSRSKSR